MAVASSLNFADRLKEYTTTQLSQVGAAPIPDVDTISIDELKNRHILVRWTTPYHEGREYYFQNDAFLPGGEKYHRSPWNWPDLPRNQLEKKGGYDVKRIRDPLRYQVHWWGRVVYFADPVRYINTLQLKTDPLKYIEYLKYAPLAGYNVKGEPYHGVPLPEKAVGKWWKEVITWYFLKTSFDILRAAQIEHLPDLQAAYDNTGKLINEVRGELYSPVSVTLNERIPLELEQWEIDALEKGIKEVRALIDENRRKIAARVVELSDSDAEIEATEFSTDPLSNPYLIYDESRSSDLMMPVFTNVASNQSATWAPPEVTGDPDWLKYWLQVPDFEADRARVYQTDQGAMSMADMRKYGYTRDKVNWLPWLAAGAAVAYAASEII